MALPNRFRETADLIRQLPQIGPRQALRLTLFLFRNDKLREALAENLAHLEDAAALCTTCFLITEKSPCSICSDKSRDTSLLTVVEEDTDLEQLEKTGVFHGKYFVLGGRFNPNRGTPAQQGIRIEELKRRLEKEAAGLKEIILAMNPTVEGDALALTLMRELKETNVPLTRLGIGLPLGGEIEYADEETLKQALERRG